MTCAFLIVWFAASQPAVSGWWMVALIGAAIWDLA